jgi:hypothetical protein
MAGLINIVLITALEFVGLSKRQSHGSKQMNCKLNIKPKNILHKFDDEYIVINIPGKLLLIPEDLTEGTYRLKVVTQFTGSSKLLNSPRQTVFGHDLTVI